MRFTRVQDARIALRAAAHAAAGDGDKQPRRRRHASEPCLRIRAGGRCDVRHALLVRSHCALGRSVTVILLTSPHSCPLETPAKGRGAGGGTTRQWLYPGSSHPPPRPRRPSAFCAQVTCRFSSSPQLSLSAPTSCCLFLLAPSLPRYAAAQSPVTSSSPPRVSALFIACLRRTTLRHHPVKIRSKFFTPRPLVRSQQASCAPAAPAARHRQAFVLPRPAEPPDVHRRVLRQPAGPSRSETHNPLSHSDCHSECHLDCPCRQILEVLFT